MEMLYKIICLINTIKHAISFITRAAALTLSKMHMSVCALKRPSISSPVCKHGTMMLFTSTTAPVAGLNILYLTLKVTLEFNSILGVQKLPFDDGQIIVNYCMMSLK
jgi:hypothetical protein